MNGSATDNEVAKVGDALWSYDARNLSEEKLLTIYERYGGVEVFMNPNLAPHWQSLRSGLTRLSNFPVKEYVELLDAIPKLTGGDLRDFGSHPHAVASVAIFERLWAVDKNLMLSAVLSYETKALLSRSDWGNFIETLPTAHHELCDGLVHDLCREIRVMHGDKLRLWMQEFKETFESTFHPDALAVIHREALSLTIFSREQYANSVLVTDDQWLPLMNDKRSVLNALVCNRLLPEEFAYEIVKNHKTPTLRVAIAGNASSKELLDFIWDGTKSESIHKAVVRNAVSDRYVSEARLLER